MEQIIDLLYQLKKKCILNDENILNNLGLSPAEYQCFIVVDNCSNLSSHELAIGTGLSTSRISRVIEKMVQNGYMERCTDPSDRRAIKLSLTDKGRIIKNKIIESRKSCENKILSSISEEEAEVVKEYLTKLIDIL